jgi:hypothetical protein
MKSFIRKFPMNINFNIRAEEQLTQDWWRYWIDGVDPVAYFYQGELYAAHTHRKHKLALLQYIRKEFAQTKAQQMKILKVEEDVRFWLQGATKSLRPLEVL